ncbi:MAG: nucleotidyl transferase AbiEii/AbiGii toxin family protein [Longimicrobiales bacterium]
MLVADRRIVTELHRRVMRVVGDGERAYGDVEMRLEGGTALAAYHLFHRESEDLDFFAGVAIDVRDWIRFLEPRLIDAGCIPRAAREAIASFVTLVVADATQPDRVPLKVEFARTSPFLLEPLEPSEEGVRVASRRDLFRGKLESVCGRTEPRDFIDLYCILWRPTDDGTPPAEPVVRARFRSLLTDVMQCDPGLTLSFIAQQIADARNRMPMVSRFPLRLLYSVADDDILMAIELCVEECATMIRDELQRGG